MRSSKELSSEAAEPDDEELSTDMPPSRDAPPKAVHFSAAPNIIPDPESEEEEEEPDAPARSAPPRAAPSRGEDGVALYDFTADGDDELSVREGDKLIVLERDNDDWWKCTNAKGQEGVVPASYVEVWTTVDPVCIAQQADLTSYPGFEPSRHFLKGSGSISGRGLGPRG